MWAPADLFTPAINAVLLPLKRGVSFFYENPMALLAFVLLVVGLIVVATLIGGRRSAGS